MSPSPSPAPPALKIKLAGASPSFRLQSPSLNTVRLRRVFDLFDRNGDGEITTGELRGALCRLGLCAGDDAELSPLVAAHTRPGWAGLGFEEFEAFHRALGDAVFGAAPPTPASASAAAEEADMKEAFGVFDEDGDGFISAKELQAVLAKLGFKEGESMESVREMICSVDHNCDGRVDFGEFKHMMAGIAAQG